MLKFGNCRFPPQLLFRDATAPKGWSKVVPEDALQWQLEDCAMLMMVEAAKLTVDAAKLSADAGCLWDAAQLALHRAKGDRLAPLHLVADGAYTGDEEENS